MNRIQRAQFRGHRLRCAVEYSRIDLNDFKGLYKSQYRPAPRCDLLIRQLRSQAKAIQGSQALNRNQSTRYAPNDLASFGQLVRLPERDAKQHGSVDIRCHRCPCRSSSNNLTTSTLSRAGLGSGTRLGWGLPAAGFRTRKDDRSRTGTICATGVSRSNTEMVSPLRTARRYSLNRDFNSAMPTCFIAIL